MKTLSNYIYEASEKKKSKKSDELKKNIMYTIWKSPDKKVDWLKNSDYTYQKIEYKHEDKDKNIFIDFLLGYVEDADTWKLWIGKIGALSYDDDPYCDLETPKFSEAIIKSLDKTEEFIIQVQDEPENWIQYYKDV